MTFFTFFVKIAKFVLKDENNRKRGCRLFRNFSKRSSCKSDIIFQTKVLLDFIAVASEEIFGEKSN